MAYYATPSEDYPSKIEADQEPPTDPKSSPEDQAAMIAELVRLQQEVPC